MSLKENELNRYKKELVTFGYIRENFHYSIPIAINKLCLNYFDEIFYITIAGNKLQQFINMSPNKFIEKNLKYNNEIAFSCRVHPNVNGSTMFYIGALFNKSKIKSVQHSFEMECKHTNSHFIGYNQDLEHGYFGWMDGFMKFSEYKNDKTLKKLTFTVYVNVHCIKYKNNINWINCFQMNKKYIFKWKLNAILKMKIKTFPVNKYIVCNVSNDKCWLINFRPNGYDDKFSSKWICISMNFLKCCNKIKQMCGTYNTNIINPNVHDTGSWNINDDESGFLFSILNDNLFETQHETEITVEIVITEIKDCDGNTVEFGENEQILFA